jgi:hypothetical protein
MNATKEISRPKKTGFFHENGLSIVFTLLTLITIVGQAFTGWHEYNEELTEDYRLQAIGFAEYLTSGHFIEATFENWESEFLQMGLYVILTVSLFQKGSSESKDPDKEEEVDREPDPNKKDAPWPVKQGGLVLKIYQNSLSIAFLLLFLASFLLHAQGGMMDQNVENLAKGKPTESLMEYMSGSRFWFESLQNWQSEFLSVLSIVVLSIFLRQKGSPESKPVDAPNSETGE